MKILVTGSAGFMGSHLVDALVEKGHQVFGIDDLSGGYLRNVNSKSVFFKQDLRQKEPAARIIEKIRPEILFHLAADATEGRSQFTPLECTERNYLAYLNTLVPSIRAGLQRVVLTSSMSVYGSQRPPFSEEMPPRPDDIYGISKAAMERATQILAEVHGFEHVIVRPHNVYGPRQNMADPYRNVIAIFINCLLNKKNFYIYGDGEQKRAFTYIEDFTPYFLKTGFQENCLGEIINIGPRKEYTISQLAQIILRTFFDNREVPVKYLPKHLPARPKEVKDAYCTSDKAERLLGFKPKYDLRRGVEEMIFWAKKVGPQKTVYLKKLELVSKNTPATWKKKLYLPNKKDKFDDYYRTYFGRKLDISSFKGFNLVKDWYSAWLGHIKKIVNLEKFKKKAVLELGGGIGAFYRLLVDDGFEDVTCSDISPYALKLAQKFNPQAKIICLDVEKDKASQKYDLVLAFEVIEHLENTLKGLKNIYRMLTPKGLFVGSSPYPFPKAYEDPTHKNVLPPDKWKALFRVAGFKKVSCQPLSFAPFLYRLQPRLNFPLPFYIKNKYFVSTTLIIAHKSS